MRNWQSQQWPVFTIDPAKIAHLERDYAHRSGLLFGSARHITEDDQTIRVVEFLINNAKLYDRFRPMMNERQQKVILKMTGERKSTRYWLNL